MRVSLYLTTSVNMVRSKKQVDWTLKYEKKKVLEIRSRSVLWNIITITIPILAIFMGLLFYRKDELIFGQWWEYCPLWLGKAMVLSSHYIGIHSIINSSRIIFDHQRMKPNEDDLKHVRIEDIFISGVAARVYRPVSLEKHSKAPAVIFMTGGGFVYGSRKSYNGFCYRLSRSARVVVYLLEYRKAPEYIFPTAFNDCYEASIYLVNNAENYSIDPSKIVLMGDDAGGNLAAAVAQQVASLKQKCVRFEFAAQVLIYPTLQFLDFTLPSFLKDNSEVLLSREVMAEFWSLYVSGTSDLTKLFLVGNHSRHLRTTRYQEYLQSVDSDVELGNVDPDAVPESVWKAVTDPRASPLLADDLRQNPPTLIVTADHDVLRDDGILYGVRLKKAGVKVRHNSYSSKHGFLFFDFKSPFAPVEGQQAFYDIVSYLNDILKKENFG